MYITYAFGVYNVHEGGGCGQSIESLLLISNPIIQMLALGFLLSNGYNICQHVCVSFSNFGARKS